MTKKKGEVGYKSPSSTWCMLRDSYEVRTAIQHKINQRGLNLQQLSKETGIYGYRISRYLNKRKPSMTQFQIMSLARFLGIEISLNIKIVE